MERAAVPKAAVHENRNSSSGEHHVRFTRQRTAKAEPQAGLPECAPKEPFRLGVRAADARHAAAPLFGCHNVDHVSGPVKFPLSLKGMTH